MRSVLKGNESLPMRRGKINGSANTTRAVPTVHSSFFRMRSFERVSAVDMKNAQARDRTNQFMSFCSEGSQLARLNPDSHGLTRLADFHLVNAETVGNFPCG
jgi:hypothetical protein